MKHTIPFDLFGEKDELCFTIADMRPLERALGKPIQDIIISGYVGFDFIFAALPLCLKKLNPHLYEQKIEEYLTAAPDRQIVDIAIPILEAICASGALGKLKQEVVLNKYYPELHKAPEEPSPKNPPRTERPSNRSTNG